MSVAESVREYISQFPLLKRGKLNVDYIGIEPVEYSIDTIPSDPIIKKYVDGGSLRQYVFVFGSREFFGADVAQNLANSSFYEDFAEWIENNDVNGILPELGDGKTSQSIEIITSGYVFEEDTDNAKYQIQCRLKYYQKRRNL